MNTSVLQLLEYIGCIERIDYTVYDENGCITGSSAPRILEQLFWNAHSDYFKEHLELPVIFGDSIGLTWIGIGSGGEFHVLGPFRDSSVSGSFAQLPAMNSISDKKRFMAEIADLPQMNSGVLVRYALIFYYALTKRKANVSEICFETENDFAEKHKDSSEEPLNLQNCWACEKELYDSVTRGERINFAQSSKLAIRTVYAPDLLRNHKDLRLFSLGMITHAAMEGGLPAVTAFSMQAYYTTLIEEAKDIVTLQAINLAFYHEFVEQVHRIRTLSENTNGFIIQVEEYLRFHICEKISLEDLAAVFHYTPYYLSRKFYQESGVRIQDFLLRERMKYAAYLLSTTALPVSTIAEMLQFSSPSHFIRHFRGMFEMTPIQYRNSQ